MKNLDLHIFLSSKKVLVVYIFAIPVSLNQHDQYFPCIVHYLLVGRCNFTSCNSQFGSDAKCPGVVVHVVPHEGGDHVVGVVVQRLQPQLARVAGSCCGRGEVLGFQLVVQEAVSCSLINQDGGLGTGVGFHKFCGVIGLA